MRNQPLSFPPKLPIAVDRSLRNVLNELRFKPAWRDTHRTYEQRRFVATVLFVPWLLSCVSENLALDLFAVCFALGLRDKKARDRYARTRDLLDAYWHGGWLQKHTVSPARIIRLDKPDARPPPTIQMKPKRNRYDIAALGTKTGIDYIIQVPKTWRHFTRSQRELYTFPRLHANSLGNLLPLTISAIALHENRVLQREVNDDVKLILSGTNDLLDRYFFLLMAAERGLKISDGMAKQLAAFGLFEYTAWSWKRPKKADL